MSTIVRKNSYSPVQESTLLGIAPATKQTRKQLARFAKANKRSHGSVYQAHKRLHELAGTWVSVRNSSPKPASIKSANTVTVVPYVLETGPISFLRGDKASTLQLKAKLEPLVKQLKPMNGSIPIMIKDRGTVRRWLTNDMEKGGISYTITPIIGNKDMLRIVRRM